ncbi:geranyl-CoA carboxylase alpha subunit [Parasphingorhabdus marina DSM 22363]|uniref:Geranyl-CoA carboxylase alpha subunit n=1 Tax=Parasphingorhabdus marina DSM 22363 TaxID=1123272 RepID=A0A1N6CPN2_9SPHN|nr:acetyl-CoA carboxylase biotin carboxylase subunit [Parasphingorhabdus marina]SIN60324.1 geranyl-CoA carboxylase alpha subunit [Parasphingorhabdus marina DSM 22363]
MTKQISTLLVANRGEIACRVMRTARAMGIRTVAVYSDADAEAPHVQMADDAVRIGPAPVNESYLQIETIIAAAKETGADAIHPGYGFLSENAAFSQACAAADIIFVGPPEQAIDVMGDKARSKRAMIAAGVPCVPGYQDDDQSDATLIAEAKTIGVPLMVKAAAGGGGRGMRLVHDQADVANAIKLARSEAENAFGNGELILEKAIIKPRHVELQVFADSHGNTIHLGERDCSVQRRHQKVIEEAPCPVMTPELRVEMGAAAVEAARAVDYRGAGTVEFLLDPSGEFYFLEMNTRLQVEHPVTEEITGLDLVALQLKVAQGDSLGLAQEDVTLTGHAMEVRLYAEDPADDFLPSTGHVDLWHPSDIARVDDGIATGGEVSPFYDSMVAKIITHGATREDARRKMVRALAETALFGPKTNRDFLIDALGKPDFCSGQATTAFIAENYGEGGVDLGAHDFGTFAVAAALQHKLRQQAAHDLALNVNPEMLDWSTTGSLHSVMQYEGLAAACGGDGLIHLHVEAPERYRVEAGENRAQVELLELGDTTARLRVDGHGTTAIYHSHHRDLHVALPTRSVSVTDQTGLSAMEDAGGGGTVVAPMHGLLLEILVESGATVSKGDKLAVLEAMKMQHEILAEIDGVVETIAASAGNQIAADDLILEITPNAEEEEA